jgi:hypothetical protein
VGVSEKSEAGFSRCITTGIFVKPKLGGTTDATAFVPLDGTNAVFFYSKGDEMSVNTTLNRNAVPTPPDDVQMQEQNSPLIEDQSLPAGQILEQQEEAGSSPLFVP